MQKWSQFATSYQLDPQLGYLINPCHKVTAFNYDLMLQEAQSYHSLSPQAIVNSINNFPDIGLQQNRPLKDMAILHDISTLIVCVYNRHQRKFGLKDQQITIPRNLAEPLYVSSTLLGRKLGMCANFSFMWTPLTETFEEEGALNFGYNDFKMKCFLTSEKDELLFFGGSVIAAFYLAKINRIIYEINALIDREPADIGQIKLRLQACVDYWEKIVKENHRVLEGLDSDVFFYGIRFNVQAFKGIRLQGANQGQDVVAVSPGGTGGNDPSFQIFQQGFGIRCEGTYREMQLSLQTGMSSDHRRLIEYYGEHSKVREFCSSNEELRVQYNCVLLEYTKFLMMHGTFISQFIVANILKEMESMPKQKRKGTGGLSLQGIVGRYRQIEKQLL